MDAVGIGLDRYDEVYELAVSIYNDQEIKGPFGIDFMIQAAKRLLDSGKKYEVFERPTRKGLVSCTTCQGTKIEFKSVDGKIIGMERNEDGSIRKCAACS